MSAIFDITAPFTAAELVAAAEGREGSMLRVCREAAAQIEEKIRARIAADGAALGKTQEEIDALLDASATTAPPSPPKRERAPKARPEATTDLSLDPEEDLTELATTAKRGAVLLLHAAWAAEADLARMKSEGGSR